MLYRLMLNSSEYLNIYKFDQFPYLKKMKYKNSSISPV